MTTILLARHGETHWNRERRIQGWAATELSDRGQQEATALGRWLDTAYDIDHVAASDLQRTRETTDRVREAATGLPEPTLDSALRERGFGVYQGFLADELFERYPDHDGSVSSLDIDPEHGESIPTFRERVRRGWKQLCERTGPDETTLAVTHGGVIKVLLGELTDRSRAEVLAVSSPDNCSVTEFRVGDGETTLLAEGITDWRELDDDLLD